MTPTTRPRPARMPGADAAFLYLETPAMHMHTLKIAVLEPGPEVTFDNLVRAMLHRLRRMPALRHRILPVPLALNHPVLLTQQRVDPSRHFFRHDLGGNGTLRELEELVGRIASTPIARDQPLWEIHCCEGIADGTIAVVGKIHHALADGQAANAMLANLVDVHVADRAGARRAGDPRDANPGGGDGVDNAGVEPSSTRMVLDAIRDAVVQIRSVPALLIRSLRALWAVLRFHRTSRTDVPLPVRDAPRVSFDGPLTPARSFTTATLSLDDLKTVRRRHAGGEEPDPTLNDVVLAVVSGALRRWLRDRGEAPDGSLTAGVPVGLDVPDGERRLLGNNVSNLFTTLATDVDDPERRLRVIARTTRAAKGINQRLGPSAGEWAQFLPPAPFSAAVGAYSRHRMARLHPPPFSVIVSNVPGPRERMKIGGARIVDLYSVGPLVEGIGLNVTVWSYVNRMNVSLLACPDLLPDVAALAAHLPGALAELLGVEPGSKVRDGVTPDREPRPEGRETA